MEQIDAYLQSMMNDLLTQLCMIMMDQYGTYLLHNARLLDHLYADQRPMVVIQGDNVVHHVTFKYHQVPRLAHASAENVALIVSVSMRLVSEVDPTMSKMLNVTVRTYDHQLHHMIQHYQYDLSQVLLSDDVLELAYTMMQDITNVVNHSPITWREVEK